MRTNTHHTHSYPTYVPHAHTTHTAHAQHTTHTSHTPHTPIPHIHTTCIHTTHSTHTPHAHIPHTHHTLYTHYTRTRTLHTHGSGPGGLQGRLRPRVPAVTPQACGAARRWGAPEHERNTDANARARCTSVRRSPATRALARTPTRPVPRRRAADVPFKAVLTPDDGVRRAARRGRVQGARPPPGGASPGAPVAG